MLAHSLRRWPNIEPTSGQTLNQPRVTVMFAGWILHKCILLYQVVCGLNHTVCVSADGETIWAFGDGDYGKLGLGNTTAKSTPSKIDTLCNVGIKKVCCGTQYTVALTKDGRVFTWGQGWYS